MNKKLIIFGCMIAAHGAAIMGARPKAETSPDAYVQKISDYKNRLIELAVSIDEAANVANEGGFLKDDLDRINLALQQALTTLDATETSYRTLQTSGVRGNVKGPIDNAILQEVGTSMLAWTASEKKRLSEWMDDINKIRGMASANQAAQLKNLRQQFREAKGVIRKGLQTVAEQQEVISDLQGDLAHRDAKNQELRNKLNSGARAIADIGNQLELERKVNYDFLQNRAATEVQLRQQLQGAVNRMQQTQGLLQTAGANTQAIVVDLNRQLQGYQDTQRAMAQQIQDLQRQNESLKSDLRDARMGASTFGGGSEEETKRQGAPFTMLPAGQQGQQRPPVKPAAH